MAVQKSIHASGGDIWSKKKRGGPQAPPGEKVMPLLLARSSASLPVPYEQTRGAWLISHYCQFFLLKISPPEAPVCAAHPGISQ